jgi:hypothetical protein
MEQAIHTYYRLYKGELQSEIDKDYSRRSELETVSRVAHRNKYLAEKLKAASEDVRETIEKNRMPAGGLIRKEVVWADADEITEDEIKRRNAAMELNE